MENVSSTWTKKR